MTDQESKIRVLLVDDHALVRESLARLLNQEIGIEVIGQCGTTEEALSFLRSYPVDLILLDYDLGTSRGTAVMEAFPELKIDPKVLIVTAWVTAPEVRRLVSLGAAGVIKKENRLEDLVQSVRTVAAGEACFDQQYIQAFIRRDAPRELSMDDLSSRERVVMRCLLEGMANKEIGHQISVSEAMVKTILQKLFEKTGVRTRGQLVRIALEKGIA